MHIWMMSFIVIKLMGEKQPTSRETGEEFPQVIVNDAFQLEIQQPDFVLVIFIRMKAKIAISVCYADHTTMSYQYDKKWNTA